MVMVSAPGKIILFGEHAVVYGEPAISVAINKRISVAMDHGEQFTVNGYAMSERYHRYIYRAVHDHYTGPPVDIITESELPSASGMGSSAAITVATVGALFALADACEFKHEAIARTGFDIEYTVQGRASPIDTSTVTHGAAILLAKEQREDFLWALEREGQHWFIHHQELPKLTLVAGNTKVHAATGPLVAKVRRFVEHSGFARDVVREIGQVTLRGAEALANADYQIIGECMNRDHELLAILGVNHPHLERLVQVARKTSYGAKLTGAGGGGSMVALTDEPEETAKAIEEAGGEPYILEVTKKGVTIE